METRRGFESRIFAVVTAPTVVHGWGFCTLRRRNQCLKFGTKFMLRFRPRERRVMVGGIEGEVLAAVVPAEVELHYLPGLIKLVSVLLNIEKIKMIIKPRRVLALVPTFVARLLEFEHVQRGFGPLAASQGKFLPEPCRKLLDVEDMDSLRFPGQRI